MSHEIDTTAGTAAIFTAGAPPWHGLGRGVLDAVDSQQAITLACLDWHVDQWPISAIAPDGWGTVTAKDFVANEGNALGGLQRRHRVRRSSAPLSWRHRSGETREPVGLHLVRFQ